MTKREPVGMPISRRSTLASIGCALPLAVCAPAGSTLYGRSSFGFRVWVVSPTLEWGAAVSDGYDTVSSVVSASPSAAYDALLERARSDASRADVAAWLDTPEAAIQYEDAVLPVIATVSAARYHHEAAAAWCDLAHIILRFPVGLQ